MTGSGTHGWEAGRRLVGATRRKAASLQVLPLVAGFAASAGCSDHGDAHATGAPFFVAINGSDGETPAQYVAVITSQDGAVRTATCPDAPAPATNCRPMGLEIDAEPGVLGLTIKVRGSAFVTLDLDPDELPLADGVARAEVELETLAPFVANEDYATGIAADGDFGTFEGLAVSIATELGPSQVVKFFVTDLDVEPRLYLQNTRLHPLHYDFARDIVGVDQNRADFEAATYHGLDRTAYAGSLTYYPEIAAASTALGTTFTAPLAVSFFPSDDLTPTQALECHRLLEERLGIATLAGGDSRLAYVPAGEDSEHALQKEQTVFARGGAAWLTREELYGSIAQQLLNDGVAYGTLRLLTPEQLADAMVSYTDVLLLTRLPNELPVVGGTITEELQTPLAHVNVAARARGTPNLALVDASTDPRVAPLIGELVRFEVGGGTFSLDPANLTDAQTFWADRVLEPVVPDYDVQREGLPGFDEIGFNDSIAVGVKAANLAELHQLLPDQTPNGFAVPFRYYDEHLQAGRVTTDSCAAARAACVAEGHDETDCADAETLCAAASAHENLWGYAARLLAAPAFASDSALRDAALASLRYHIASTPVTADFAAALDARVAEVFGGIQVRLRSSTNTEDLPNFNGAGLYESVSASDNKPPASDRIREVWASVWGFQAFEERSYWGIDHLAVRMGTAVNPAYDDEAANGVLVTQNIADPTVAGMYVNVQLGEVSVTNPTDGSLPEIFAIVPAPAGIQVARQRYSSLSPDAPVLDDAEINALFVAADSIQSHFAELYEENPFALALDVEFKFVGDERRLVVKQVRPYVR